VFSLTSPDSAGSENSRYLTENRGVGPAIEDIFSRLGVTVLVPDAQEDRWTFHLIYKEQHFLCRVVCLPTLVVLRLYNLRGGRFSLKKPSIYADLARRFAMELAQDSRFRDVLWYPPNEGGPPVEPDGSGSRSPLAPRSRSIADLTWRVQVLVFLVACGGFVDSVIKFLSGEFGIALSTLIGSAIFFCCAGNVVEAIWRRLSSRVAAAKAGDGQAPRQG
jgi:hypothetical protein